MSATSLPAITAGSSRGAYGRSFWLAYVANALTMIAISILVRYADFVTYLGGAEGQLGLIVGVGMIGSLCMRVAQGTGIDRYGPRRIWLWSLFFFVLSLVGHVGVRSSAGFSIFALRIVMQTSIAGIFGASITYISRRVPPERMAEIIGTLGTSGFIGMLVGPQIADWICAGDSVQRWQLDAMFLTAAGLGAVALVSAAQATRGQTITLARRQPPVVALLQRYNPGVLLLVAIAVGAGVSLPSTFLRTYAAELQIGRIGLFFAVYAVTAFLVRMATRGLFIRWGNRPWVISGLLLLAASMLLYLPVARSWQLAIPGAVAGAAHALLFPAVVASGSTRFPERYRGLGTAVMLAMFDMGNLIGAPVIGGMLAAARYAELPAYPTMFMSIASGVAAVAVLFALRTRRIMTQPRVAEVAPMQLAAAVSEAAPPVLLPSVEPPYAPEAIER